MTGRGLWLVELYALRLGSGRSHLESLVIWAAETFLMELRRAYENLRPFQYPDGLLA